MAFTNSLTRKVRKLEDMHCMKTEMELRQDLRRRAASERMKERLAQAVRCDDQNLIDRLFDAGFTAETLPALSLAPLAFVAWGSGHVTCEERDVAMKAAFETHISDSAMLEFQSWLNRRPGKELASLWADITMKQYKRLRPGTQAAVADRLTRLANEVALASGGCLGFGAICDGEQSVIDYVREVFNREFTQAN